MNATALALIGYIAWVTLLVATIAGMRTVLVLAGKRAANSFTTTGKDVSSFSQRLCRAHANSYEAFPVIGGTLLLALATGQTTVTDPLALVLLGARIGQSVVHLVSTSHHAVTIRFGFFLVQLGIAIWWLVGLAAALG